MHSSTSSFDLDTEWAGAREGRPRPFWRAGLLVIAIVLALPLALGHVVGRLYAPQPLAPSAAEVAASDHFVVVFGNSRTEAALDSRRLARALTGDGSTVRAREYAGGGWDAVHFYQLALLNRDVLRPGRDAVVIEVSPLSANDNLPGNRLGVIRGGAAMQIAALPGAPVETRLDVLVGAVAGLYRYRVSIQSTVIAPAISRVVDPVVRGLARLGFVRPPRNRPPFELVTAPGRDFVIQEVRGDRAAFIAASRERKRAIVTRLAYGGFKLEALRRAVTTLRARGITVYLVNVPVSAWLEGELDAVGAAGRFRTETEALARASGARFLRQWPRDLSADDRFWDEEHMVASAADRFTDALAGIIRDDLRKEAK